MKSAYWKWTLPAMLMLTSVATADDIEVKDKEVIITSDTRPDYANRVNFALSRMGYERIKHDAFYFGMEGWYVLAYGPFPFERTMGEIEARAGWNFFYNNEDRFTPFAGIGCFKSFKNHEKQSVVYVTSGILYEHKFTNLFDLGVNLKALLGHCQGRHRWGDPVWGYDISVPLTFHFGERGNWDFRLEPFYIQMFGHNHTHNFGGGRSAFGYRF